MEERTSQVIDVINRLSNTGLGKVLELPRICVVGAQSAGKSSVLEAVVGIDFLPKASGLCTRRPLEIRMRRDLSIPEADPPFAYFVDNGRSGERITDFAKVTEGILSRTDEVAGDGNAIVDDPIVLTIHQRNCHTLTLIDLPGVTRVAMDGQQENIERITRQLSLRYIKEERTIILAVLPGNNDVTNADSLHLAREVDREGVRTIGVVTKIDLVPAGTDPSDILQGRAIPLRHGYVGVLNRSQAEINSNVSIEQALANEAVFIKGHKDYSKMHNGLLGIPSLRAKLSKHLSDAIVKHLPSIRKEVDERLIDTRTKLKALGEAPRDRHEREVLLSAIRVDIVTACSQMLCSGTLPTNAAHREKLQPLLIKAKFRNLYTTLYARKIASTSKVDEDDSDGDGVSVYFSPVEAIEIVKNENITLVPNIITEQCFRSMCTRRLQKLFKPAEDLVDEVEEAITCIVEGVIRHLPALAPFVAVRESAVRIGQELIAERRKATSEFVHEVLECETQTMYANGIDLSAIEEEDPIPQELTNENVVKVAEQLMRRYQREKSSEANEELCAVRYRDLAVSFMEETRLRLRDAVPRIVHQRLVCGVAADLAARLADQLSIDVVEPFMSEDSVAAGIRDNCETTIKALEESRKVLRAFL